MKHRLLMLAVVLAAAQVWAADPSDTFRTSLHATRAGKSYWYSAANGGFERWTGVSMEALGCRACHGPTDADGLPYPQPYTGGSCVDCHASADNTVSVERCYGCHGRQAMEARRLGLPDVHRDAGMVCWNCHTSQDLHGDGVPEDSMLEPGAITADCVDCHQPAELPAEHAEHDPHGGAVHCTACHTASVISCYNCHFESQVEAHVKRPVRSLSGFVLLVNRATDGAVHTATFQSLTYDGHSFVAYAPYTAHTTLKEGRRCGACHLDEAESDNAAIAQYNATGAVQLVTWDPERETLEWLRGVVPVPADYHQTLRMDFMTFTGDPAAAPGPEAGSWTTLGESVPDGTQMLFATPLTREQMAKLGFRLKE